MVAAAVGPIPDPERRVEMMASSFPSLSVKNYARGAFQVVRAASNPSGTPCTLNSPIILDNS